MPNLQIEDLQAPIDGQAIGQLAGAVRTNVATLSMCRARQPDCDWCSVRAARLPYSQGQPRQSGVAPKEVAEVSAALIGNVVALQRRS